MIENHVVFAQRNITGTVSNGINPLAGVTGTANSTNNATLNNDDGRFTILAFPTDTLIFSFIGLQVLP